MPHPVILSLVSNFTILGNRFLISQTKNKKQNIRSCRLPGRVSHGLIQIRISRALLKCRAGYSADYGMATLIVVLFLFYLCIADPVIRQSANVSLPVVAV